MQFLKKNMFTIGCLAVMCLLVMMGDASAQTGSSQTVMDIAKTKTVNVFGNVRTIIFMIGGFGLVAVAFAAIFGKVNWKWFAGLAVGLAILAAANAIVHYATGEESVFRDKKDPIYNSIGV